MKVDKNKLMDTSVETEDDLQESFRGKVGGYVKHGLEMTKKYPKTYKNWLALGFGTTRRYAKAYKNQLALGGSLVVCLALIGVGVMRQLTVIDDRASAETIYDETLANPSFIVQHVADVTVVDMQSENGAVPVMTDDGNCFADVDEDGALITVKKRVTLYDDYETDWLNTNSIELASFLNGSESFWLKEIWFGDDTDDENPSNFLIMNAPDDLNKVILTNNPENPDLSEAVAGHFPAADEYTVCVQDGDVIRLVFEPVDKWVSSDADVYDYDVTDGGYYLSADHRDKGELQMTSDMSGAVYVDAMGNGINSAENYSENTGAKLGFGGADIGSNLADESVGDGLNTINVYNYGQDNMGVTKGLVGGLKSDGALIWADDVAGPGLFGESIPYGRTDYDSDEYTFTFRQDGYHKVLSAVESEYGTAAEDLEFFNGFWILDVAPSYGTDGHDIPWGSGSEDTMYYVKGGDPKVFKVSADGYDHNSFFGFKYVEDFVLSPGYSGPLDFFGYSDDDLWVFAGQVDEHGVLMEDTVVQVLDLGGVHGDVAYYSNLWDVIDKVGYDEEEQNWKLFVYWLERDGSSASCYMSFNLPEAGVRDTRVTGSMVVEAKQASSDVGDERVFILDDGTHDRYQGTYGDGDSITIVSGEEFIIPNGAFVDITGLTRGESVTVTEIGAPHVWASLGDGFDDTDTLEGLVGTDTWLKFLSSAHAGELDITVDAYETPKDGYPLRLTLDDVGEMEVSAMDGENNLIGSRLTDENGEMTFTMNAGETFKIFNLPENVTFKLEPENVPGYHVTQIVINNAEADGRMVTGHLPAYVGYTFEENGHMPVDVVLGQSINGNWSTDDIGLGQGAMLSYQITVVNVNDSAVDVTVTDVIPDGLEVVGSTVTDDGFLQKQTLTWELELDAYESTVLEFTCQVVGDGEINNTVRVVCDEMETDSNIVTAIIRE